jgi:murein DD-endopeptidase MepM/ murein hydrolase activator NlpD
MLMRLATGTLLATTVLACLLLVVSPAFGQEAIGERKAVIDGRIDVLEAKIDAAREREGVLTAEIAVVTSKIRGLQSNVDSASARLDELEDVLALHQRKLDRLNQLYRLQTRRLVFLQRQQKAAIERLNKRLVEIYTSDPTSALTVLLEAASFSDLLDQLEFLNDIGAQDEEIAGEVEAAKLEVQETRNSTRKTRKQVAATTATFAARTAEQRAVRDSLAWTQRELATARRDKQDTLATVEQTKEQYLSEVDGLRAQSAALAGQIQAAQASAAPITFPTGGSTPSAGGFIWPVQGTLTSPYGPRWGRIHEGIDIAAPTGTPLVAAAAGRVILSGWSGGYGYLVVLDHGNGIATAYAHNSSLVAGVGQDVVQGQLIAYVGNTGNSFGSHVHFEVRISGSPVDPLGYL